MRTSVAALLLWLAGFAIVVGEWTADQARCVRRHSPGGIACARLKARWKCDGLAKPQRSAI